MEQGMMTLPKLRAGFSLVAVLVLAAVGLLIGAGSLLMFNFQCRMRIDRQHELEKVYAVRSALNYIKTASPTDEKSVPDAGKELGYHTQSGRDLNLLVKPVASIFPSDQKRHLFLGRGDIASSMDQAIERKLASDSGSGPVGFFDSRYDCECGSTATNLAIGGNEPSTEKKGFAVVDRYAETGTKWWANIGMRDTGGWLQEDYGRRYVFNLDNFVGKGVTEVNGDIVRLCIVRAVTNSSEAVGQRHGWPLSKKGERAIVFEMRPLAGKDNASVTLSEWRHTGSAVEEVLPPIISESKWSTDSLCGIQLAGSKVSIFYISKRGGGPAKHLPYTFSVGDFELTGDTYDYFAKSVEIGGRSYGGVYTNEVDGTVHAPELRVVLEVEAASTLRKPGEALDEKKSVDFISDLFVTPAYQYDVFMEHPANVTNRATVAQKTGEFGRGGTTQTVLTYDTHGTDHKGFRRDEREHARGGGR